jgi:hypothetical protein
MPLSWNEIKDRALSFSKEWNGTYNEEADAKPFLEAFFNVFGITRKKIASFEHKVKKLDARDGYIDLFWKGTLLVEMKSKGKNLDKAYKQAREYLQCIEPHELPQYILISDFDTFRLFDYESEETHEFLLSDFVNKVHYFGFIAGYIKQVFKEQDPVNIKAATLMGKLHDRLKVIGYDGHPLELYLVRLLFCLFAEDTTIFEKDIFNDFIINCTSEDGSDLAARLSELFYVLNTSSEKRFTNIDEQLNSFPYVNGKLFEEALPPASFDTAMRNTLIECCGLNWGSISPAIFGSMFQSVMNPIERRNLGAHYTSEKNILKLIKPLFLDELWQEFESVKKNRNKLIDFHKKLSLLKFLDPACGCGNFLVITYRELRLLEIEVLRVLYKTKEGVLKQGLLNVGEIILLDVDMMNGIECEEFPARIAQVAMWLIDHQMNMAISLEFGQYFVRLPLKKSANIINSDALQIDWESIVGKDKLSYIFGNPPFIGSKIMKQHQRNDIVQLFENGDGGGTLDYVTGWYLKAAKYIQNTTIKVAFVSTNSIVQGEQTSILWGHLLNKYHIKIHFAHRTFKWSNEAKGNAAVYCVIIGFASFETNNKVIYEYEDIKGNAHELKAKRINPYLVDAKDVLIEKKSNPICNVPKMSFGNMPLDGGHLLLSDEEKNEFLLKEPQAKKFIRPLISAYEFLNGLNRWCLWLINADPSELKHMPEVLKRVQMVKEFRLESVRPSTIKSSSTPTLFGEIRDSGKTFILIPGHTSENRSYIPIGFFGKNDIANNSCFIIPNGNLFHFGVLMSCMHMVWVKNVCGRLKSDFRYSKDIVYNNYPWPPNPTDKQKEVIETASQNVLDARALFPNDSLADLYDPLTMPPVLTKAHQALNKAVDVCYRPQPFTTDANRMEFLFSLYEQYLCNLFVTIKSKNKTIKPRKAKEVGMLLPK